MELPKCPHCGHSLLAKDLAADRCWFCEKKLFAPVDPEEKNRPLELAGPLGAVFHLGQLVLGQSLGGPKDALRFLRMIVLGLGSFGLGWLVLWPSREPAPLTVKTAVVLWLAGGAACAVGVVGLLTTTLRFRMYKSLALTLTVLVGIPGSLYTWHALEAAESERRHQVRAVHQKAIESYLAIPVRTPELSPFIRGKLVVIVDDAVDYAGHREPLGWSRSPSPGPEMRPADAKLAELFFELPRDLQAETPDEVGTIVWIKSIRTVIGEYAKEETTSRAIALLNLPSYAYRHQTTVVIVDRSAGTAVGGVVFTGTDPLPAPDGEKTYKKLDRQVLEYLKSLPRK